MNIAFVDQKNTTFQRIMKICNVAKLNLNRENIGSDCLVTKEGNFVKLSFNCFNRYNENDEYSSLLFLTELSLLGLIDDDHHKRLVLSLDNEEKKMEMNFIEKMGNGMSDFIDFHLRLNNFFLENTIMDNDDDNDDESFSEKYGFCFN